MSSSSVNRCIAIAAHGRRCQQSTYRGSPYCWHHTQSRKVWAPSRVSARPRPVEVPAIALAAPETPPVGARHRADRQPAQSRPARAAGALPGAPGDGTVAITRAHGYVEVRGRSQPAFAGSHAQTGT